MRPIPRPGRSNLLRTALAAGSGVLGVFAFPPFGLWPLALLSVAGLTVATRGRRCREAAWLGFCFGAGLFAPMLHWTATYVGAAPWLILVFSQTWYTALMAAGLPLVQRLRAAPVWVAALWVAEELVRDRLPFGGFPWGRWAFSQAESPLRWFASLGGAPLVTFAVAVAGAALAGVRWQPGLARKAVAVAVPVLVVAAGALLAWPLTPDTSHDRTVIVAAIQGDVPDRGLEFNARRRQVLDNHVRQTMKLAAAIKAGTAPRPDIVLWPENSSDIDPTDNADANAEIQATADAVGVPILVGALLDGPGPRHVMNAGLVWEPSTAAHPGAGQTYVKRHPVPFAEYIPLRSLARRVSSKVNLVQDDMVAGRGNGLLTQTPFPIGGVICFEVAYDGLVNSSVRAGAQLLVIQTNNATFGHSGETYQQLAMAQLRAVEHARTVVQVSTSGKSAIVDPTGRITAESGALFTADTLLQKVTLSDSTTLATRIGAADEWFLAALALVGIALAAGPRRWRSRRTAGSAAGRTGPAEQIAEPAEQAVG